MAADDPSNSDPTAWLETIAQASGETIRADPRGTIIPPEPKVDTAGRQAFEVLQRLGDGRGTQSRLEYSETLGQGGMGIVRLATQVAIGRDVAVKSLRKDRRFEEATLALLREAWIAGNLEHPNVVPVYSLALDSDGSPIIVLKRIEGVEWDELIDDAEAVRERFGDEDLLEWNLKILLQVIDAVRFAHSRGIIHRDLKPDNVMIGEFGEVYLLDWGIALSLKDDGSGRLPLAKNAVEMAGTPVYMAPEMLGGDKVPLTERTDIYLCGAVLCEILTGQPPHDGESAMEIIASVARSEPTIPDHVPEELARICRRAMDPDPDGRFERVEQLRLALRGFLQHRGSLQLSEAADERRIELDQTLALASDDGEQHDRIYELFDEARFGYRQALSSWAQNEFARVGIREATITMVNYELEQANPRAAARLIADLNDPPAELAEQVAAAMRTYASDKERVARLEELGRDLDFAIGQRTRSFLSLVVGIGFTAFPVVAATGNKTINLNSHASMMLWTFAFLLGVGAFFVWARESMMKTAINRRVSGTVTFMLSSQIVVIYGCQLLEIDVVRSQVLMFLLWFACAGMTVLTIDKRFVPTALGYLCTFLLAAKWPQYRWELATAANALLTINAVWVWRPPKGEFLQRTRAEIAQLKQKRAARRAKRDDKRC